MTGRAALIFLAVAVLAGGLREPALAACGAAGVALLAARRASLPSDAVKLWLPWLFWAALSCLLSAQPWAGLPVLARWSAFAVFISLAAGWDESARRLWLKGLCFFSGVLAVAALATGMGRGFGSTMTGLLPPYYNYTAFVLAAAAAAAAAWALNPDAPRGAGRAWLWALVLGLTACLLLARSRGGLLGLGAAAAWLIWRRAGGKAVFAIGAVVALAVLAGPHSLKEGLLKRERLLGEARPGIWRAAAGMVARGPWLGEGPGNFAVGFRRGPVPAEGAAARWGWWTPYAHSEPLQAAAETGWVGLALWLMGLGAALWAALRGARAPCGAPRAAAQAALIAVLPQLLVDNMLQLPGLAFFFASLLGTARGETVVGSRRPSRGWAWALAAFALASAAPGLLAARARDGAGLAARRAAAERAVRIFPADADRVEDLAHIFEEAGQPRVAAEQWERAERLSPFNAIYPWRRARLSSAASAEAALRRALELEPDFMSARVDLIVVLCALGRRAQASAQFDELRRRTAALRPYTQSGYERTIVFPADFARAEAALAAASKR